MRLLSIFCQFDFGFVVFLYNEFNMGKTGFQKLLISDSEMFLLFEIKGVIFYNKKLLFSFKYR